MNEINGTLCADGLKFAFVVSRVNSFFTEQLLKGAVDCFVRHGGAERNLTVVRIPGANEAPLAAKKLVAQPFDAVVVLGAVIQGATPHAGLINGAVSRALAQISLESGKPVINGIIAADTIEQAVERSGTKAGNKGYDVTASAIEMVQVCRQL